ncbi:oxidoreductase [Methylobacterium indicum]|uniref:Oxidoreductase n=1 Tax=Methylobacterium indicum TaxID=1775910 RepID=A0ABR5HI35_9HYPH|nr:aldo/keto reductase [Methylobacterium indicum]KMO21177.1 oxidoreductase [Methylobacterium indicum]KMO26216.1 oxidoreductase [Methylobacterium indicum]KTS32267.1 oxidoreductase [Methylobacterium indicum]KTS41974.1 oxidoreductase [Methylobacterium indicum]KTS47874.1 oxidoreductase [Methylobacterium indicum]
MSDAVLTLNDGKRIPQLGFGVWRLENEEAPAIVGAALEAGYRSIDTAAVYGNEAGVGRAIAASGLNREDIFVATKVWNDRHGYDETLRACEDSLARLGLDHVDLYLVHWPVPQRGAYLDTWRALMRLREDGRARSIGVSNFTVEHLKRVIDASGSTPAINQVELHPRFQQTALRAFHAEAGIVTEAWAPLGRGGVLDDPAIRAIAEKHGRTPAQVVLRWQLDIGNVAIPKSATPARIRENRDVAGFTLDADDLARITALDDPAGRMGPDPETFGA